MKDEKSGKGGSGRTFGTRLILGLFFISSLMVLVISGVVRVQMHRSGEMLTEATQNHLITAAHALTKVISIEELDKYHRIEDTETEEYQQIKHRLAEFARDNNLLYAYYWRGYGYAFNQLQFIVDNDFDPEEEVGPWEIINIVEDYLARPALAGNTVVSNLSQIAQTWDELITAYAPMYDSSGRIYAIAGVDVSNSNLYIHRRDSRRMTLILIIAIPLSIISGVLNMILYRRRAKQIQEAHVTLANERDLIQTMKDNINQGIFLMNKELNILPLYSSTLISILSYYDEDLTNKNFLDVVRSSFDAKQLQVMKGYFNMVFAKEKSAKILEAANPISEFEYKVDDYTKYLSTRFRLIEQKDTEPVVIGIVQDISREKEIEHELQIQKENQEMEMKNLFDVLKVDPNVFQNFIEDTDSNFHNINALFKDRKLSEKEVVTKIFQYVHGIKSNALILDLESLSNKLHVLEDDVKAMSNKEKIVTNDLLSLTVKIENFMQEMDSYTAITKKINTYKSSNQMDTILVNTLSKAVEKLAGEAHKSAKIKSGEIDLHILESNLRKPIKDILFQCVRNSIYHGIEPADIRIKKGKNPQGLLLFSIKNIDGRAEIIFSDDGGGLNWEKIRQKYLEKNPGAKVDRKVLLNSIFSPEFSTAEETTTAAGRGVGLSLIRDIVRENNGTLKVNSSDLGLTFNFSLPWTDRRSQRRD